MRWNRGHPGHPGSVEYFWIFSGFNGLNFWQSPSEISTEQHRGTTADLQCGPTSAHPNSDCSISIRNFRAIAIALQGIRDGGEFKRLLCLSFLIGIINFVFIHCFAVRCSSRRLQKLVWPESFGPKPRGRKPGSPPRGLCPHCSQKETTV